jgi:hypothetical protein
MTSRLSLLVAAALLFVWSALAAADAIGPLSGFNPATELFDDVYSPPLTTSDTFATTWAMHVEAPFIPHYAGFLFDITYDGHELSSLSLLPAPPHALVEPDYAPVPGLLPAWTFQGSMSSSPHLSPLAVWIPPTSALNSGIQLPTSFVLPLFQLVGHAKNTTPANNGDIDISISFLGVIQHNATPATFHFANSMWVYVVPGSPGVYQWAAPGEGQWLHVPGSSSIFVPPSAFYATNFYYAGAAGYGIEHLPEPISAVLMLAGLGAVVAGRRRRRTG